MSHAFIGHSNDGTLPDFLADVPAVKRTSSAASRTAWTVARGRRRQSQSRLHRHGSEAPSSSSRRCPMCVSSANPGPCRCRAPITSTWRSPSRRSTRPKLVPKIYHYDRDLALIVMEYLTPHVIMRKGLIRGIEYPLFAATSPNSWRRLCSTHRCSPRPPPSTRRASGPSPAIPNCARSPRISSSPIPIAIAEAQSLDHAVPR